ncbi:LysM peptidoglycan-binding domain-containing protein [Parabacteroides chinchillae]
MAEEDKYIDAFRTTLPVLIDKEMYKVRKQQRSLILLVCVLLGVNMLLFGAGLSLLLYNRQQPVMVQPVAVPAATNALTAPETAGPESIPEPEPEPEEVPEIIKRVPPAPKPRAKKEPVRKEPATELLRTAGHVPEYVLTSKGMTLQNLAARYYGDRVFWVCIFDYNSRVLKDPDVLPLGIRLRLPRKEEYGIDASDPSSLRRARALAKSLTGR